MNWFLWVLIARFTLNVCGKLYWLVSGNLPPRKPSAEAADVLVNAALVVWAAVLLARA